MKNINAIEKQIRRWFAFYGEEFSTLENARKFAYFYGIEELTELFDQLDSKEGEQMKKILINKCYGGFDLSSEAKEMILKELNVEYTTIYNNYGDLQYIDPISGEELYYFDLERDDLLLVKVVETLGSERASGPYAELKVVQIPSDVKWVIEEYDGSEWISEVHRTWE